ncbi:MAG TPA: hypothetical protein VH307_31200 [Streptosporangiaceae bacterium]|jgi:hypothetical protein|nr:hypothetical protein [Streptosporangiaceae bacterium]
MGRPGRTPFRNRTRDRRYAEIIKAATAHPSGTRHVIPVQFPDEDTARKHMRLIYHEGRYQGYGRKVTPTVHDDGTVTLTFQLWTKAEARAYVAAGRDGQGLAYNVRRKPKKEKP